MKKLQRGEFIRMAALGGVGLYLGSCNSRQPETTAVEVKPLPSVTKNNERDVIFYSKGDKRYDELRSGFNKRINKFPEVVALCKTTEGVVLALEQANKSGLPVAVKSGGHCMEGFSVNDGGMAINLSQLNKIETTAADTVRIEPGAKLMQVYDALLPEGKLIPAGACGTVGIGGLTLGGGYGFFSRKYGLTCDNLVQLKMVDGLGNVHIARDNDELLWANRGGGTGNFGIVTEMNFTTHPMPRSFQSHRFKAFDVDVARAVKILEKWFAVTPALPLSCFSAFVMNGKRVYILLTNYDTHTNAVQQVIDELSNITDKTTSGEPVETAKALKVFYGSLVPVTFKNSCAGMYSGFDEVSGFIEQLADTVLRSLGMIYQVNTMGGNIGNKAFESVSAYPHRAKAYVSELQAYWEQPAQGKRLMRAFSEIQVLIRQHGITSQYCNYPATEFNDYWQQAYYGNNYARLQSIKKKYDPHNLIRHEQSVTSG